VHDLSLVDDEGAGGRAHRTEGLEVLSLEQLLGLGGGVVARKLLGLVALAAWKEKKEGILIAAASSNSSVARILV
jgi:hypothetical protein